MILTDSFLFFSLSFKKNNVITCNSLYFFILLFSFHSPPPWQHHTGVCVNFLINNTQTQLNFHKLCMFFCQTQHIEKLQAEEKILEQVKVKY